MLQQRFAVVFFLLSAVLETSGAWVQQQQQRVSLQQQTRRRPSALFSAVEDSATTAEAASTGEDDHQHHLTRSEEATQAAIAKLSPEYKGAWLMAVDKVKGALPVEKQASLLPLLIHFSAEYFAANQEAFQNGRLPEMSQPKAVVQRFLTSIQYGLEFGMKQPYQFNVSHTTLRGLLPEAENGNTIDFYQFGIDFFQVVIDLDHSKIMGLDNFQKMIQQIEAGENVVLFANHQSEADPQVLSICLDTLGHSEIAEQMIFVAGHKVTTDPLAIPFSMGRNLICIHSKKHIDADPATKPVKQKQNMIAMNAMLAKFQKGGTFLWVAPSGGRDRRNVETRDIPLAPFDRKTIDIFRLFGNKSKVKTHYYTLAMVSYDLCPPPDFLDPGVGEQRNIRFSPVGIYFGNEVESTGGLEARHEFTDKAFQQCQNDYNQLNKVIHAQK